MKKIMNYRPALFVAVAVVSAVVSSYLFFVVKSLTAGAMVLSAVVLIFAVLPTVIGLIFKKPIMKIAVFSSVALLLSAAAFFNFYLKISSYEKAGIGDKTLTAVGRVDELEYFDGGVSAIIGNVVFDGVLKGETDYRINVFVYGESPFDVGDTITFTSVVSDKALVYEGRFAADDVSANLRYYSQVNASEISVVGNSATIFQKLNLAIRNSLKNGLGEKEFAVAYALLCGNSDYTGTEAISPFRQAGVAHIFAVSGLHIGFLAAILGFVFRKLKVNPYVSALSVFIILFLYSGVCGFTMSSLRATIMCGVAMFAMAVGERYDGLSSVSLSAVILTVVFPTQVFSAGFSLSFSVVYGIILLGAKFTALFKFLPQKLSSMVGALLSAQVFSVPLLIAFFGQFTLLALITNLIFLPVVGFLYALLFVGVILSVVSPYFLFLQDKFLYAINFVFNALSYDVFIVSGISLSGFTAFYYVALVLPSGIINLKRSLNCLLSVLSLSLFLFATAIISFNDSATVKAHVVGSSGASVTVIEGSSQYAVIVSHADRWFNPSRISRAINDCKNKTGYVFVISGVDVNSFMTKFNALSRADVVYYFDQIAENDSAIYENSFKGVSFNRNQVGERIDFKDFSVEFNEGGKAAKVVSGGQSICVFGEFNDNADFNLGYYDLVIAYDYVERISALYQYKTFLSYRRYGNVLNAENQGNYVFKFI